MARKTITGKRRESIFLLSCLSALLSRSGELSSSLGLVPLTSPPKPGGSVFDMVNNKPGRDGHFSVAGSSHIFIGEMSNRIWFTREH